MVEESPALERVVQPMRERLEQYAQVVRSLSGENAKSLVLFGAVATPVFDPARQTARSVLILCRVDLSLLRRLAEHGVRLGKASIAAPLIMTPEYVQASLDTFPLELMDIQQNHLVLFGEDYFAGLSFDDANVRLQCERELKAILIGLRQGLLAAAGRVRLIGALEADVAEGLMRTLRGMLWLEGQKDAKPREEVLATIEQIVDRKLRGIRTALDAGREHSWDEFEALYADVEALGEVADAW
jgi:hypothetical protein